MRTTDERVLAVQRRAKEIQQQKQVQRNLMIHISSAVACLMLIVGLSFFMPNIMNSLHTDEYAHATGAASMFYQSGALGFVCIGLLSFLLGICVTILCYRLHQRDKENQRMDGDD